MALTAGSNISQYKIIARLGSGGMGEVYLAQDERLRRKVALKLLFDEVTKNEDWVRRFEQEAYAASALKTRRTQEIDKKSLIINAHFGLVYYLAHRFDESIAECKKAIELNPSFFVARYLGLSYAKKGYSQTSFAE
jgi:serine/threonine protein kinase